MYRGLKNGDNIIYIVAMAIARLTSVLFLWFNSVRFRIGSLYKQSEGNVDDDDRSYCRVNIARHRIYTKQATKEDMFRYKEGHDRHHNDGETVVKDCCQNL
uniref:Transmembrane protein n=1 Tax=Cacopsylla melanoneura TaxID=428564 RepID=A0A8D8W7Q2_9HEMI